MSWPGRVASRRDGPAVSGDVAVLAVRHRPLDVEGPTEQALCPEI